MGLDINSVRFLVEARLRGADFGEVLTFGRQDMNVFPAKMVAILEEHGFPADLFKGDNSAPHAEPCFLSLGARKVYSMDVSSFEGASFIHDLNEPVATDLKERFDLVYDGGTLEHVFNFPIALKNCMEMVRVGGRLFMHTVANNWCGHGFYQFSPELFFRALSRENGFEVERIVAHRVGYGGWYEVNDPQTIPTPEHIASRVEVRTLFPVPLMLLIQARRLEVKPVFARAPQQSDYQPRWKNQTGKPPEATPPPNPYAAPRPWLSQSLPGLARLLHVLKIGLAMWRSQSLRNRKYFRPVKKL